ncbi:TorF family putative porin [Microbulbifer sp. SAOS-129_SWC]|uniref:TorF family putative porin n=1 Tax=Microbulbifer sp. SAOS-129_SWC TaxID=3145235 RepID=UPI003216A36B
MMNWVTVARLSGLLLLLAIAAPGYCAEEEEEDDIPGEFGGSLLFSTNYMFRSISNSNNRAQVQGDMHWSHDSGIYVGLWASNTDFGGVGNSMELDPYIGIAGDIGDSGFSYDIGYWSYNYPGSESQLDYGEFYFTPSYSFSNITISPGFWYADNYFGHDFLRGVSSLAYEVTVSADFQRDISLSAHVGEQTFKSGYSWLNYTYWDFGIAKDWNDFNFSLRWYDTNDIEPFLANPKLADGNIVFGITRSF